VATLLRVEAKPSAIDVHLELDVRRDGQDFFRRSWDERIERRLL
jgi:hypothetical protein